MEPDADFVALGPALASLALGDDPVFFFELIGSVAERLFSFQETRSGFAA